MNQLLEWLSRLFSSWKFWVVVPPWDRGVRIRLGKIAATLNPGPHWRIPFLDEITLSNTRLRILCVPPITISSEKEFARCVKANIGYKIVDPVKAMQAFATPDMVVLAKAQGAIAALHSESECRDTLIAWFTPETGISIEFLTLTENVDVKTYRLLQEGGTIYGVQVPPMIPGQTSTY